MSQIAIQMVMGLVLSGAIGFAAYRRRSLSRSGIIGALVVGTAIFGCGGWVWGMLLITFFVSSSLLSHYKEATKEGLAVKFAKGHRRDLGQVAANGGTGALIAVLSLLSRDATALAGAPHARAADKPGYRWGRTRGSVGFHGGKVEMERPRVRSKATGKELPLSSWKEAAEVGWLEQWATNLMLMNVATRKVGRAVRLPEAGVPAEAGSGLSKSAVSRRFKALTQARLEEWMASDLSALDLLVIQIDGLHMDDNLLMLGAVGVDADGRKHPLGVVEGATENAATVQALLDNLIDRGLDPAVCRLFIVDGAKALTKAIRRTFGADIPIQRCQIHKARNITERLDPKLHAAVRRALRQAWELDDADKAERLLRKLARRMELEAPGVSNEPPRLGGFTLRG